jgi:hypothetical protein
MVPPVEVFQQRVFQLFDGAPRTTSVDQLGLDLPDGGLGQGVVVRVADRPDRRQRTDTGEGVGVADRGVLTGALLFSMIIGFGGGILAWLGGDNPPDAVIAGAAAFAATMTLAVLVLTFLSVEPDRGPVGADAATLGLPGDPAGRSCSTPSTRRARRGPTAMTKRQTSR